MTTGLAAAPGQALAVFPALLVLVVVLLFSTATLAFYVKRRLSLHRLGAAFGRLSGVQGNAAGALLGSATPFCTCTAVPLFIGLLEVDAPVGPAVSFLLASPTINLGAIILLLVIFGWHNAVFYGLACLVAAVLVGWTIGRMPRERTLRDFFWMDDDIRETESRRLALSRAAWSSRRLTRRLLPWLLGATAAGLCLDALLPTSAVSAIGGWGALGIPIAALLGSVVYADILFLIPVGYALIQHGASVPVILTFMLAASGLSLPELIVLSRVLQPRAVALFAGATVAMYVLLGFGFAAFT